MAIYNLVGGIPTPLQNMISSVGMMTFPIKSHNVKHIPNHQPVIHVYVFSPVHAIISPLNIP